ncbi:MAG: Antidote-toxin recognition MazE, bacterial antitoxin, partial [Pseudomonadota bacterium]
MRIKIAKWGNSAAIRLPKAVMDEMRLVPGSEAEMNVADRVIRITSANKPSQL